LRFDHTACKGIVRYTELAVRCANGLGVQRLIDLDSANTLTGKWLQVELIEKIVEVSANIDFRVFTQNGHVRQSERLAERSVNRGVAGPAEGVAGHTRRWWNPARGNVRGNEV